MITVRGISVSHQATLGTWPGLYPLAEKWMKKTGSRSPLIRPKWILGINSVLLIAGMILAIASSQYPSSRVSFWGSVGLIVSFLGANIFAYSPTFRFANALRQLDSALVPVRIDLFRLGTRCAEPADVATLLDLEIEEALVKAAGFDFELEVERPHSKAVKEFKLKYLKLYKSVGRIGFCLDNHIHYYDAHREMQYQRYMAAKTAEDNFEKVVMHAMS